MALTFPPLADGQVAPVSGPWILLKTLLGGYLTACGMEDDLLRLTIYDSYEEDALQMEIWLNGENLPVQAVFMQRCYSNTLDLMRIMPPGWKIGGIDCNLGGTSTSWSREIGRISIIDQALTASGISFSARSISGDGNTAMAAMSLGTIDTEASEPTKNMVDLKNNINDFFQSIGQAVSLTDYTYTSPQQNVYNSVKFKFSSGYNPRIWSGLLTKFSGLEMNSIKYNPETGVWDYEGAIYAL
jgi:hypothetical protein